MRSERAFGIFPRFFRLVLISRFVKQLRGPRIPLPTREETLGVLRELLEAGLVTPVIDSTFPLSDARAAVRHVVEDGLHGKVIIRP